MPKLKPESPPASRLDFPKDGILNLLHSDDEVAKTVKDYNERYLYWDEVKRRKAPPKINSESLWKLLKFSRNVKSRHINVSSTSGFDFNFNITDSIAKQLHRFDLNLGDVLEVSTTIPEGQGDVYMINAIMEEAIASSQLEGAATTRKVAKEMLRSERKPKNHSEKMILNNYLTIKEVKKHTEEELTPNLILKLHQIITSGTLENPQNEGRFRKNNEVNVVDDLTGEIYYVPPHHSVIDQTIMDICDFANSKKSNDFIHPILRAITLHFLIGYLHPFADGNGRTVRAIFYWYMMSKGYWLVEYISISRTIVKFPAQYVRAYLCTEGDGNDLTYFFNYNLKVLQQGTRNFRKYVTKKIQEKSRTYELQKIDGLNERQVEILGKIKKEKHKFFTIKEVQNIFGVVYQTARMDLLDLESSGYLIQKKSGKKILFHKSDDFDNIIKEGIKQGI